MRSPGSVFAGAVLALVAGCSGWSAADPMMQLPVVASPWLGGSRAIVCPW
jgi:hypothetical protein